MGVPDVRGEASFGTAQNGLRHVTSLRSVMIWYESGAEGTVVGQMRRECVSLCMALFRCPVCTDPCAKGGGFEMKHK